MIKGLQLPDEDEWGPAIQRAIGNAVLAPTTAAVLDGAEVPFGVLVVSRDGLTVRRRRGRDDFTTWRDVVSITVTDEGVLEVSSRGPDFPTHYVIPQYRVPHLEVLLAIAHRQRTARPPAPAPAPAPAPTGDTEEPSDTADQLSWYVTFGLGAWAAWRLGSRQGWTGSAPS